MRKRICLMTILTGLLVTQAYAQRVWYLWPDRFDGTWTTVSSGGYLGTGMGGAPPPGAPGQPFDGRYFWGQGFDGVRRAWWKFENNNNVFGPLIPAEPRMYLVETWVPPANATAYSPLEVQMEGYDQPSQFFFWGPNIPWNGQFGTNRQWIDRRENNQGQFVQCGPGPQAPQLIPGDPYTRCSASGNGQIVWLKRGTVLFVKFDFSFYNASSRVGVSAIRITEVFEPTSVCGPAVAGGPLDLRCVGNQNPLLGSGTSATDSEDNAKFANSHDKMLAKDDSTLAVQGWVRPCTDQFLSPPPTPLSPGLPLNGNYTVQLPSEQILFKLGYDGLPAIKWAAGDLTGGPFDRDNIFTLNPAGAREFVQQPYGRLFILSCKSSGSNGELVATAVYTDNSTEDFVFKLYDWFNTNGDAGSRAVGVNGDLRSSGPSVIGFRRINSEGVPSNGGDHSGAFFMFHEAQLNGAKSLKQLKFRVRPDNRGNFEGSVSVVAVSLDSSTCKNPVFDVVGGGAGGDEPDGAVDQRDFGVFQQCMGASTTPGNDFDPAFCGCFDRDGNYVINDADFIRFQGCWTGPSPAVPVNPACDD